MPLLFLRDRFAWHAIVVALAGFYFDKDEPFTVPANNVNFTGMRFEPADQDAIAVPAKVLGGRLLTPLAERHFRSWVDSQFAQPVPSHTGILTGSLPFNKPNTSLPTEYDACKNSGFKEVYCNNQEVCMQRIQEWLVRSEIVAIIFTAQGCALFLIGAGAGTAVGVVSYTGNEL